MKASAKDEKPRGNEPEKRYCWWCHRAMSSAKEGQHFHSMRCAAKWGREMAQAVAEGRADLPRGE